MEVIYNGKIIKNKEIIPVKDTQIQPKINFLSVIKENKSNVYTLILHDPDAVGGNKIHWLKVNIQYNDINTGKDIISYKGPSPPINTGIHHYKFKLYKQDNIVDVNLKKGRTFNVKYIKTMLKLKQPIYKIEFCSKNTIKLNNQKTKKHTVKYKLNKNKTKKRFQ
jgi:phosphatidylethanolamine-binding protein (PEBP) family uncharacterized protein